MRKRCRDGGEDADAFAAELETNQKVGKVGRKQTKNFNY